MNGPEYKCQRGARTGGFALVIALSLMAFVLLLLLSITTLTQVETRSAQIAKDKTSAQQNALLSLQMAIGQLQELSGADTRVTASSRLADETNVALTGVWRSWEGSDRDSDSDPIPYHPRAPNYEAKLEAGDPSVGVAGNWGDGRFLGWLTSVDLSVNTTPGAALPNTISSEPSDPNDPSSPVGLVPLLAEGSVIDDADRVYLQPTPLEEDGGVTGGIAWWTSGDNQKATVNVERGAAPSSVVEWQQRVRAGGRADSSVFDLDPTQVDREIPSLSTLDVVAADPSIDLRRFHDMTVFSSGLLTNTANGGWRRDLSLMTESYDGEGESVDSDGTTYSTTRPLPSPESTPDLPFYTLKPGVTGFARKSIETEKGAGGLIYPWAEYRSAVNFANVYYGPISSWTSLVDYAMQYKQLRSFSEANTQFPVFENGTYFSSANNKPNGTPFRQFWGDKIRIAPVVSRVNWVYSLASRRDTDDPTKYVPQILVTPFVTLWNPYNVALEINYQADNASFWFWQERMSLRFQFSTGGNPLDESALKSGLSAENIFTTGKKFFYGFPSETMTLEPGATKLLSLKSLVDGSNVTGLQVGYASRNGIRYDLKDEGAVIPVDAGTIFSISEVSLTGAGVDPVRLGLSIRMGNGRIPLEGDSEYGIAELGGLTVAEAIWPPIKGAGGFAITSGAIEGFDLDNGGDSRPFAAMMFAQRGSSPLADPAESDYSHQMSRGMLQSNPLAATFSMGLSGKGHRMTGTGVNHPINSIYDLGLRELTGWGDSAYGWIPQDAPSGESYIVSGLDPATGLTRCVMAEIPTRPLQSLVDLQHWDAGNNNPVPPFQINLIGNSSATPIIPADAVFVKGDDGFYNKHMCNDDSYLLNNLLFDDWFVSSIAPDFGDTGVSEDRTIGDVYKDHLTGAEPLPNRFYLPVNYFEAGSTKLQPAVDSVIVGTPDNADDPYPFETVASQLTVDGMFNVNSASVDAWRALLRQAGDLEVPYIDGSGNTSLDTVDAARPYSFPRTSIAGDQGTNSGSTKSGAGIAAEFAGHQVLTEVQIDELARQIVIEIRKRGPFLSLSEFVNRQMTTDTDLALAGTIQKALDNLADLGSGNSLNPFKVLQQNSVEITQDILDNFPGNPDYGFPEAALGHSAFGLPGWIRQADILRPMAPRLSARDDTFTIRAYGDVRDPINSTRIVARAWCEATLVRTAEFVDATDEATVLPNSTDMNSELNKVFGRKYTVVSFRWLTPEEI